ncbi:hypothetical protein GA830_09965 [Mesorhizobium sp. NBSH29]|uniref:protein-disulfide reductase DsbD domain-containing protein n=1 Tax=Mesorhizobium sp. NBSH29 TaxID=2654249 RepID=UPI001896A4E6|nr:protein-disulfide reductase DsbD domain-containing protein [Mesorhizobium sp. NBSH29]QPC87028.1 hypothetical protein GA830_09965 [Mesorhizobium sp. NBSH29]
MERSFLLLFCLAIMVPAPASAGSSDWVEVQGGRVRLVTAGGADAKGVLRGALDIDLEPGWKTYWRDPGDAGVPPQLDVSKSDNIDNADMQFPAPVRVNDGYSVWAGYTRSVAFPISFTLASPEQPTLIEADIFLGICETICIPVQATLKLDPAGGAGNEGELRLVGAAFSALPAAATVAFGAEMLSSDDKEMLVSVNLPGETTAIELFVAGDSGYMFGVPQRVDRENATVFAVPILGRPAMRPEGGGLPYTLTAGSASVEGTLTYP